MENSLWNLPPGGFSQYLGAVLFSLGGLAFSFLVPALAGYIAFAIADRPGIAPGFTAGAVAVFVGAGFIGGIVGGLIAGFAALWISKWTVPKWFRGLMPVVIIPLCASLIVGLLMFMLLGRPLAAVTTGLTNWLSGMSGTSAVLLGVILGLMMCFDLGGPVNKAAYAFAVAGLTAATTSSYEIMGTVMAAGMVPPLAMALATFVRPRQFSEPERENGRAAVLLGLCFISEGAIPFAAADPFRVIPSMMFGGAITGAICMAAGVTSRAPHGGIFVFFAIGHLIWFIVAILDWHGGGGGRCRRRQAVREAQRQGRRNARAGRRLIRTINPTTTRRTPWQKRPSPSDRRSACTPDPRPSSPRPSSTPVCR